MRLIEFALFLAPLAAWLVWRGVGARVAGPSTASVAALGAAVAVLAAGLVWFALTQGGGRDAVYHPARLLDGRIVPGAADRAAGVP